MDQNNAFYASFSVGFPNNPNLDVSGHFGCKFFLDGFPYPQKPCRYIDSPGSRELKY